MTPDDMLVAKPRTAPRRGPTVRHGSRAATGLRLAGASWDEIAETLDFDSAAEARRAVMADLAVLGGDADGRSALRDVEGERLNRLLRSVWVKALDPQNPEHLQAVRTAVSLIDRRAKLYGLDAPDEIIVRTPTTAEIDRWVAEVVAGSAQVVEGEVVEY